jgi:hypothetical protein
VKVVVMAAAAADGACMAAVLAMVPMMSMGSGRYGA